MIPSYSQVFKIEIGDNYEGHSNKELRRRIWKLEKAVWQLQEKVFHLQANSNRPSRKTWVCTISNFGDNYTATGETKAVAKAKAIKACSKAGGGMFCKDPNCEQ